MKIRSIYEFFCFFIILLFVSMSVFAEDLPSETSSQSAPQSQNGNGKVNENTNPNKPTPTQNNETSPSEKPASPKSQPKPKQSSKKVKKASNPENSGEDKKPDETPKKSDAPVVKLPDISSEEITETDITPTSSNNISDKIVKGIISWIMILAGLSLIIWVISKNRKINKNSHKINNNNSNKNKSKPIYYKGLHRK